MAYDNRDNFWFGTIQHSEFIRTPNRGADSSPESWGVEGTLLNGGGYGVHSWGSHKKYTYEWPSFSSRQAAQKMKSYRDGTYGRGLLYFIEPTIYTTNLFPARWADPSMTLGNEGVQLIRDVKMTAVPTPSASANDLPITSVEYDLFNVTPGFRGESEAVFIPIPEGHTLFLGGIYTYAGTGGVFFSKQLRSGGVGAPERVQVVAPTDPGVAPQQVPWQSNLAGVWVWFGKDVAGTGELTVTALTARLLKTSDAVVYGPWVEQKRNLFPNPNLVGDGSRVTVWENFFTNPGFETAAPGSTTIPAQTIYRNDLNAPTTTGWTASLVAANGSGATGASVALQGAAGARVVRVQSDGATTSVNPTAAVRMTRTLSTVVGVQYTVTYQYKSVSSACMVRVSLGTAQGPETSSNVLAAGTAVVFTATATTTTLAFDVYDNPGSTGTRDSVYGELGDVTVTQASYTVPTAPIEVRRNLIPQPMLSSSVSQWENQTAGVVTSTTGGAIVEQVAVPSGTWIFKMIDASGAAMTAGTTYSLEVAVQNIGSVSITITLMVRTAQGGQVTLQNAVTIPPGERRVLGGLWTATAGTTRGTPLLHVNGGVWPQGAKILVEDGPNVEASPIRRSAWLPTTSPDPDLTPAWTGTVNNSASVLNGTLPATPNNGHITNGGSSACILTTGAGVQHGTRALRIIPLGTSMESHYQIGGYNTVLLQPGKTYTVLATITVPAAQTGTVSAAARRINTPDSVLSGVQNVSAQAPNVPGTYPLRYTWTVSAGATWAVVRLYNGASAGNGDVVWDDVTIVEGVYNGPHIAGDVPYNDPDLIVVWAGTANASNSQVTGEAIQNVPSIPDRCIAVHSSKVVDGVAFPMRLIAKRNTNDTFVNFNPPTAALAGGTFMATRYQEAVIPGLISRALWIGTPAQEIAPVNVAGTHEYRLNYTTLTANGGARFYHGGQWGTDDVWLTMPGLFVGTYTGPWFTGGFTGTDTERYRWDGTPNSSDSVYETRTRTGNPAKQDEVTRGPWIGGQGHSGCRFSGMPSYVTNSPIKGGQIGFAATFIEVGDSLYG